MGGCAGKGKDPEYEIMEKAYNTFKKLDANKNNRISSTEIERHFGAYSAASAKVMLRQIDLDNDGIITKNDWIGYWELVRRAGYKNAQIMQALENIRNGQLSLNFPNINSYNQAEPRVTVVNSIVNDLKRAPPQKLPFSLEN